MRSSPRRRCRWSSISGRRGGALPHDGAGETKVATDAAGEWLVVKVNTEDVRELGERFRIRSIPTLALFQDGREINRAAGARPAADIRTFVSMAITGGATGTRAR